MKRSEGVWGGGVGVVGDEDQKQEARCAGRV